MSLILDALRRAERERRAAGGVGPSPVGDGVSAPRGRGGVLAVAAGAGGILALAVAVGVGMRAAQRTEPVPPVSPAAEATGAPPVPGAAVPLPPAQAPVAVSTQTLSAVRPASTGGLAVSAAPLSAPVVSARPALPPVAPTAASRPAALPTPPSSSDLLAEPSPAVETPATGSDASPPKAMAAASPSEPPLMRDLPEEVRERIGRLEVSAHVYAADPAERFVFLNGKVCRVGDPVGNGVVLERITPEGAVIDYGEGRARLEANRY